MKRTISGQIGKGDINHNNRKFIAANVDKDRVGDNITLINDDIKKVYHELFDEAQTEYNAKQKRKDRRITNYYEKILHGDQEKVFHEVIFQIGNMNDTAVGSEAGKLASEALRQYAEGFQQRNPHLRLFNAVIHLDEATPHIHLDFVPFATDQTRGLSTRVSLTRALEQQGFTGEGKLETNTKKWIESEKEVLAGIMLSLGIEWEQLGTHNEHLSVLDYKKQERTKEVAALDDEITAKSAALSDAEAKLGEQNAVLEKNAAKISKIKDIDSIEAKKSIIGSKITVSESDFHDLTDMAKKQAAAESKEKSLNKKIKALKQENSEQATKIAELTTANSSLKAELSSLKSIKGRISAEGLKAEVEELKAKCGRLTEFIESLGLMQRFKEWLVSKTQIKSQSKNNQLQ